MKWILVLILSADLEIAATKIDSYDSMDVCFAARDVVVEGLGRPIIGYQVVCVAENVTEETNI